MDCDALVKVQSHGTHLSARESAKYSLCVQRDENNRDLNQQLVVSAIITMPQNASDSENRESVLKQLRKGYKVSVENDDLS